MKLTDEQHLYVRSMGKLLRVTAFFTDVAEANAFMEKNDAEAVVAEFGRDHSEFGHLILLANRHDNGERVSFEQEDVRNYIVADLDKVDFDTLCKVYKYVRLCISDQKANMPRLVAEVESASKEGG